MMTANTPASRLMPQEIAAPSMQFNTRAESRLTDLYELTVIPCLRGPTWQVTMVTPVAKLPYTRRSSRDGILIGVAPRSGTRQDVGGGRIPRGQRPVKRQPRAPGRSSQDGLDPL